MAKVTPARITYFLGETEQTIRFHAVISEAHQATSEITKFPVQSGFQVSNHAIRHNRKVNLEAVITNAIIAGGETAYQYSSTDNSKTIFKVLKDLVNLRIKTTVLTNLDEYTPVLFNSFKTKQVAGQVDSIKIILSGEELQVANTLNSTAPTLISWTLVEGPARIAKLDALNKVGVYPNDLDTIEEATVDMGSDFVIGSPNHLGQSFNTTYLCKGHDPTTGAYSYDVHTDDTALYVDPAAIKAVSDAVEQDPLNTDAGPQAVSNCSEDTDETTEEAITTSVLATPAGVLQESDQGAYYSTMSMTDNDVGQELIGLSAGCVVRGVEPTDDPFIPEDSLPTTDQVLKGANTVGANKSNPNVNANGIPLTSTVLTQISRR